MFPLNWPLEGLHPRDFMLLELQFNRTIFYFLPCESVHFVTGGELTGDFGGDSSYKQEEGACLETWRAGVNLVRKERQPVANEDGSLLFLPIWDNETIVAVALLTGGPSVKYGGYSADWLHERSRLISRELRRTKQWAFDPESGLLTGRLLRENIETLLNMESRSALEVPGGGSLKSEDGQIFGAFWSVFLFEIFPKAQNSGQSSGDIARAGACLNSFVGDLVPLTHFGSGLFGMLWNSETIEDFRSLGYALLRKLKRQNFSRVYIGIAPVTLQGTPGETSPFSQLADQIMAKAWGALKEARSRGPFALCSASRERAEHIFKKPSPKIRLALENLWRGKKSFSLAIIQAENNAKGEADHEFPRKVCSLVGGDNAIFPENSSEAYIYLANMDGAASLVWLESFREKISHFGGPTYYMGIAECPCPGFSKADCLVNARKALTHNAFFGPGTATVFDGISLNISGDVYYNEGDLPGAIKEYKLGLKLAPDNINLMNSLAVIYAQVNRYHLAIPLLEKVIKLNPKDFMALFNLGFAYLRKNDTANSIAYFEKALAVDGRYFDLLLQLGQLYCTTCKYKKAVAILKKAEKTTSVSPVRGEGKPWLDRDAGGAGKEIGRGLVYAYLGRAYQGIGDKKEAMTYFQRAIGYNGLDAQSLSCLGELYLEEGQGNDIALSLCRQALNIEENNPLFWLRLARINLAMKNTPDALKALQQCLLFDRKNIEALLMLGGLYKKMGQKVKAKQIYKKILKLDEKNKGALGALQ